MCDCKILQDYRRPAIWVSSVRGNVPPNAVSGGEAFGNVIYISRVNHFREIVIGKLLPRNGCCYIGWKGSEFAYYEYEVLCNPDSSNLCWEWNTGNEIPAGALQGGYSADGERLYIGRRWNSGTVSIGTIVPSRKCLYASFYGKVYAFCDYEILVCKSIGF